MRINVEQLSETISKSWDCNRVTFTEEDEKAAGELSLHLTQFLPTMIASFFMGDEEKAQNIQAIQNLYDTFGEWRIREISNRWDLDIQWKKRNAMPLTAYDVHVIFSALGDVRIQDLKRLYSDIVLETDDYLDINEVMHQELRDHFKEKEFKMLRNEDIKILHSLAVPFENLETMFCHNAPRQSDSDQPSMFAGALEMMKWRVQHIEEMRRAQFEFPDFAESVRKAKRVYNYFMPTGVVIPHSDGYTYVYGMVNEHGCYKFFHKSMNLEDRPNMVSYLGTQATSLMVPKAWETVKIDLHPNIGAPGAIETYDDTHALLTRPVLGFVESEDEKVDLFGFSLGGALGGYDLCLFADRVRSATFVSSPGLDIRTLTLLSERVNDLRDKVDVTLIWDADDHVRLCGEGHIGLFANPEKLRVRTVFVIPEEGVRELPERPSSPLENLSVAYEIFTTLTGAHLRETSAHHFMDNADHRYSVVTLNNEDHFEQLGALLDNRALGWEKVRREYFGWTGDEMEFVKFWMGKLEIAVEEEALAVAARARAVA